MGVGLVSRPPTTRRSCWSTGARSTRWRRSSSPRSRRASGTRASDRGSSARSGRTSRGSRLPRSGSTGPSPRASRRTGLAITTHAVLSDVGAAQLTIFEEEGVDPGRVVIGHADSYPHLDHYLGLIARGASIEFDFLGMSFTPHRAARRGPDHRPAARAPPPRPRRPGPAQPGRVPQQPAPPLPGQRLHVPPATTFLPRLRERGVSRGGDRPAHDRATRAAC